MFINLQKEMINADIGKRELAEGIGISYNTFRNKIRGRSEWRITEMLEIQKILGSITKDQKTIDYLFKM